MQEGAHEVVRLIDERCWRPMFNVGEGGSNIRK